ncbi:MAG: phosphoenolpyruvate--protein phosphotransferase [Bifidobacteriaceae bacterium]|jgi:phosphotransferase system enzyme I (PtsI)|nr:phosphoenolpyruvate--protein phosphotransferase [Bifidobacteriaceae bacterium]
MKIVKGKAVSGGVSFGHIHILKSDAIISEEKTNDKKAQLKAFEEAKLIANEELTLIYEKTVREIGQNEADIIDVQRQFLVDPDLNDLVISNIENDSDTAAFAVSRAGKDISAMFSNMDDAYMKGRATDVADLTSRLAGILAGNRPDEVQLTKDAVIVAEDITPSQTLNLDKKLIAGFVTQKGSDSSHSAILARTLEIPSVVQADIVISDDIQGLPIAIDADAGRVYIEPTQEIINLLAERNLDDIRSKAELEALIGKETVTKSGRKLQICANIGGPDDMEIVLKNDAEGIGLYRSEFLYLGRLDYPTEDEQYKAYSEVVESMKGKSVVIRTMDIGADKKVEYFDLEEEENPALGFRALRICLDRVPMFRTQLRAIYRAAARGEVWIMFPMVASIWEVRKCKSICEQVAAELKEEGIEFGKPKLGIMIETPAAAVISDALAKEVDFFSIGTNDLTQYTLAVDRQNEALSKYLDKHHPALLKLIETVVKNGHREGIPVSICGELGADLQLTKWYTEIGLDKVSVSPPSVLKVRKAVRELD